MRFLHRLLIACLAVLPCFAQDADLAPKRKAITSFYSTILTFKESGIPSRKHIQRLAPLVSRTMGDLLAQAWKAERLYASKNKEAVPPLIESRVFYSLFEGATAMGAITPESGDSFLVDLSYSDGGQVTRWQDRVFLAHEGRRWVVDDIEFLGKWEFGDKGRVQDNLRDAIRSAQEAQPE
jgi:hypothetical protein